MGLQAPRRNYSTVRRHNEEKLRAEYSLRGETALERGLGIRPLMQLVLAYAPAPTVFYQPTPADLRT